MTDRSLAERIERQVAEQAGLEIFVEEDRGVLRLGGRVDSEEARQAAQDIAATIAPGRRIRNDLDVETILPTSVGDFASGEPTAELEESVADIEARGGEVDADLTDQPLLTNPTQASGPDSWGPEDMVESGEETYVPAMDPVLTTDERGRARVLGGFGPSSMDSIEVDRSAEDILPGDEALADAIRRELKEDGATTGLDLYVVVREGVAHLRGRVAGPEDAENAEAVASRVPGVREVVDEIEVMGT